MVTSNHVAGMREGCLVWDANAERPDIRFCDGTYYGGLHCGNTLDVLIRSEWLPARVEYSWSAGSWFLDGVENGDEMLWLTVRK